MGSKETITKHINQLLNEDYIYAKRITEVFNVEINSDNISELETLINLLEIHEEALKKTRRILMLKQQTYLMSYMATFARNLISE